jgi:hypothetical protein
LVYRTRKILNNISSLEIQAYVRVQVTKYTSERHYFPNWNFMLKTRTILIVSCRPGISLLCSSSSYKIFNLKNIIFQIGIVCRNQKKKKSSKRNCLISRINQKLPDYVRVQVTRYSTKKTLYSKLEFYAENENDVHRYVPT